MYPRLADRDDVVDVRRRVAAEFAVVATFSADAPDHLLVAFQVGDGHVMASWRLGAARGFTRG